MNASRASRLSEVFQRVDADVRAGRPLAPPVATGLTLLDEVLGGGLRPGELALLGGPPGLGKTTLAVQIARNVARAAGTVLYTSFEHDEVSILARLLALEAYSPDALRPLTLGQVREALNAEQPSREGLEDRLARYEGGTGAALAVREYASRVEVLAARAATTVADLDSMLQRADRQVSLVVVDYLQKLVPPAADPHHRPEQLTEIVEGLKELALQHEAPVLAVVAMEKVGGGAGGRLRVHDMQGPASLSYEADVVLLMQDKYDVVARHHLMFGTAAQRYMDWVVVSVAKNRGGAGQVDLEIEKHLASARFGEEMRHVVEQLMDERVYVE